MEKAIQTWSYVHENIHPHTEEEEEDHVRTFEKKGTFGGY